MLAAACKFPMARHARQGPVSWHLRQSIRSCLGACQPRHRRPFASIPPQSSVAAATTAAASSNPLHSLPTDTSMMSLWERVKQAHPGAIVLFQNGDFYEIFQDNKKNADCDVDLACAILNVREAAGRSCRMAGVPVRTAGPHLGKLARAGHKLVLVEQSPDPDRPAQGGGGGKPKLIARRVTRVVTPGTLTDEEMLEPGSSNVLMAVSTVAQLGDLIGRISPREVCLPRAALPGLRAFAEDLAKQGVFVTWLPEADSAPPPGTPAASREQELGLLEGAALRQLHAYVDQTLMPRGSAFRRGLVEKQQQAGKVLLHMDAATLQALEVVKGRNTGTAEGSLLQMVNKTVTAAGSRTLRARLAQPLLDPRAINARLDSVETLCRAPDARGASRKQLRKVRDVHRALQRLAIGRWTSADLVAIQDALTVSRTIADEVLWGAGLDPGLAEVCTVLSGVQPLPAERRNPAGERIVRDVTQAWSKARQRQLQTQDMLLPESLAFVPRSLADLETELSKALRSNGEQAPVAAAAGVKSQPPAGEAAPNEDEDAGSSAAAAPRVIQPGYSPALDAARQACDVDARIAALQVAYRQSTGLGGLRILKLRQAGRKAVQLVVHVPSAASQRVTLPGEFKWVQDLTSAKRFVTDELLALDQAAREAQQGVTEMEAELVQFLRGQVLSVQDAVKDLADALAQLDVAAGMAELASQSALTRPVVEPGLDLDIVQGRHIAVEKTRAFVANDLKLQGRHRADAPAPAVPRAPASIYLLTAPNTSGKSTFLRSNAIIVILAQAGCYVPAQAARVGIVDRVFSRVGASDDLPGARSTFMVEMEEAAAFLTQATPRSLVIVDELGRGTSPEEGLAIAWATLEELARIGCRALFATHFHRLVKPGGPVEASAGAIACVTTRVSTAQDGTPVFTFRVEPGVAGKSFGLYVAALAGLPSRVLERAVALHASECAGDGGDVDQ